MKSYPSLLFYILPYLAIALILSLPGLLYSPDKDKPAEVLSSTLAERADGPWRAVDLKSLVLPGNYGWLKVVFAIPSAEVTVDSPPKGLFLSGGFSASVNWNGVDLGVSEGLSSQGEEPSLAWRMTSVGPKGQPALRAEHEIPGPIDAVVYLPRETTLVGNNTLLMEMSSHRFPDAVKTIISGKAELFGLRIGTYSKESRRPIGYYAVPFLMSVVYLIAILMVLAKPFAVLAQKRLSLALLVFLMIAATAEIVRAFYSYPYNYQDFRLGLIAFALASFASTLLLYSLYQCTTIFKFTVPTGRRLWVLVALVFAVNWGLTLFVHTRAWVISFGALSGVLLIAMAIFKHRMSGLVPLLCALICLFVFSCWDTYLFVDQNLYAASIPLITILAWPERGQEKSVSQEPARVTSKKLLVKQAGSQNIFPFDDIVVISGAGNYSEILLQNGSTFLDDRGLKVLNDLLPDQFYRVHRSHIVNLEQASALRSLGAGKYVIEMKNQKSYPVSRNVIGPLRQRFEQ